MVLVGEGADILDVGIGRESDILAVHSVSTSIGNIRMVSNCELKGVNTRMY